MERMKIWLIVFTAVISICQAEVLYQTGWEYGNPGRTGVIDSGNPHGTMDEIGNTDQHGLGYVETEDCFDGEQCLRIDWEYHGDGSEVDGACEWYVQTPNVMMGVHEYYIGFAIKLPDNWENPIGRKMIYRVGGDQHSLFFSGTKGYDVGQNLSLAGLWFKNKRAGTADDDWSQCNGEKLYLGGPRCHTYSQETSFAWPGCENPILLESDGLWHTIVMYVREDAVDGAYTLWFDGHKVIHIDKDSWNSEYTGHLQDGPCPCADGIYDNHEADFSSFKFPTYFNFGPPNHDQSEYWDSFIVATSKEAVEEFLMVSSEVTCGNGDVETGEDCDDGNTITESCDYGLQSCTVCDSDCQNIAGTTSFCGDGTCDTDNEDCSSCEEDCGVCSTNVLDFEQGEGWIDSCPNYEEFSIGDWQIEPYPSHSLCRSTEEYKSGTHSIRISSAQGASAGPHIRYNGPKLDSFYQAVWIKISSGTLGSSLGNSLKFMGSRPDSNENELMAAGNGDGWWVYMGHNKDGGHRYCPFHSQDQEDAWIMTYDEWHYIKTYQDTSGNFDMWLDNQHVDYVNSRRQGDGEWSTLPETDYAITDQRTIIWWNLNYCGSGAPTDITYYEDDLYYGPDDPGYPGGYDCSPVHDADTDCVTGISITELIAYINRWIENEVSLQDVMGAIVEWKG